MNVVDRSLWFLNCNEHYVNFRKCTNHYLGRTKRDIHCSDDQIILLTYLPIIQYSFQTTFFQFRDKVMELGGNNFVFPIWRDEA